MGFILSKFRKTKPSTKELLEKIDKELKGIQRFQIDTEVKQKRIIGKLLIFSSVFFMICALAAYLFSPYGLAWKERLLYLAPFVVFPLLIWSLKYILNWWFQRKIINNKEKVEEFKKERERLLEEVMDKETFKVAKEILEKFAPSHLLPKYLADQQRVSPMASRTTPTSSRISGGRSFEPTLEGLRRRTQANAGMSGFPQRVMTPGPGFGPVGPGFGPRGPFLRPQYRLPPAIMPGPSSTPGFRGPFPALSSEPTGFTPMRHMMPLPPVNPVMHNRSTGLFDKLADYLTGDGPAHRYALICRYCATHNGLATPEEFPFTGYRCACCRQFNPPKQQRPSAHTLPRNTVLIEEMDTSNRAGEESANVTLPESEAEGERDDAKSDDEDETNATEQESAVTESDNAEGPETASGNGDGDGLYPTRDEEHSSKIEDESIHNADETQVSEGDALNELKTGDRDSIHDLPELKRDQERNEETTMINATKEIGTPVVSES